MPVTRFEVGCLIAQPPTVAAIQTAAISVAMRPSDLAIPWRRHSIQAVGTQVRRLGGAVTRQAQRPRGGRPSPAIRWWRMRTRQRYRFRTPSTGREVVIEADPGRVYVDRSTGEPLEVVGELLPLAPTASELPWAVENLRFCNWCDQHCQKDLNDCPHCGRRMDPLEV